MTTTGGKILVVDDLPDWREMLGGLLEDAGYDVQTASDADEAMTLLRERPYHVAVLDMRLEETEESDESGLDLAEQMKEYLPELAIIMFTAFASTDTVLRALQPQVNGKGIAFDFLQKHEASVLINHIELAFAKAIKTNPTLDIEFSEGVDWSSIQQHAKCLKALPLERATIEVIDLLQRIFHDKDKIYLELLQESYGKGGVLLVRPTVGDVVQTAVIVKFDQRSRAEKESANYHEYVEHYIGGARRTQQLDFRANARLGGIAYLFVGAQVAEFSRLDQFYKKSDAQAIQSVLNNLFRETCYTWYQETLSNNDNIRSLGADYKGWLRLRPSKIEAALIELTDQPDDLLMLIKPHRPWHSQIRLRSCPDSLPNPLSISQAAFPYDGPYCYTHGDLHEGNVLVDNHNLTWLIDFSRTGLGHPVRDFAMMESAIKFYLQIAHSDLCDLYVWERTLLDINSLTTPIELDPSLQSAPELIKATAVITHLRQLAAELLPTASIQDYLISLYFHALKGMTLSQKLSLHQRRHALLSTSLLANKLTDQT